MEQNYKMNNGVQDKEVSDNEDLNRQFHPAFCDAMTQIFEHDTARYEYEREYNLNSMPNRIDFLVIKLDEEQVAIHENDKYIWLKALSDKLTFDDAKMLAADAVKEKDEEGRKRMRSILDLVSRLNSDKDWMKEMKSMGAFRDLFKEEFEEKDKKIQDLSEQLQSKNEELQSKDEQLQSKDKELQSKDEQLQSKDEQLQSKEEQLQSKEEQLQSKDKQLQSKDKEVKSLKKELEYIKEQMKNNKIAIL